MKHIAKFLNKKHSGCLINTTSHINTNIDIDIQDSYNIILTRHDNNLPIHQHILFDFININQCYDTINHYLTFLALNNDDTILAAYGRLETGNQQYAKPDCAAKYN